MADNRYLLAVAIDFGTTFSGYAFSFKAHPNDIKTNKNWGENLGFQSYKTPTTVMVDSTGNLKAFGFEAEDEYSNLSDDDATPEKYALFKKFKMMLHGQKIGERLLLHSTNGNIRPAVHVFAMALKFLKNHVIKTIGNQLHRAPTNEDIRWVLTVPAIWGDAAKQFMRRAAKQAGLITEVDSKQLLIALEPEAASLYCRNLEMKQFQGMESQDGKLNLDANSKYMIIDAGGGTIDITIHQTLSDGKVKELYKATGGPWGGSYVDDMYEKLLCEIFGSAFINNYKEHFSNQWLNMMVDFEKRKRGANPSNTSQTNFPLNMGFAKQYEKYTKKDFESVFKGDMIKGVTFSTSGMLRISAPRMAQLFEGVLLSIESHIRELLKHQAVSGVKYIFLVGGFGESAFLKDMICKKFGRGRKILVPEEASMCVLKGAVLYGHSPDDISSRMSKLSYAVSTTRFFVEGKDDEKRKRVIEGVGNKITYLKPMVQAGEELPLDTLRTTVLHPLKPDQTEISFALYNSNDRIHETNTFPDDKNVFKMGVIVVKSPDTSKGKKRDIKVSLTFGGTQIQFHAIDLQTKNEAETSISYG